MTTPLLVLVACLSVHLRETPFVQASGEYLIVTGGMDRAIRDLSIIILLVKYGQHQ